MTRFTALIATSAVGATLWLAAPGVAAPSGDPGLARGRVEVALPTTRQVARIYPQVKSRKVQAATFEDQDLFVRADKDCVAYSPVLTSDEGGSRYFFPTSGDSLAASGKDDPAVFTYEFSRVREARRALKAVNSYIVRCKGTHKAKVSRHSKTAVTLSRVSPDVDGAAGYTIKQVHPVFETVFETHVVTRHQRFIVVTDVASEDDFPGIDAASRLARLQVRILPS